MIILVSCIPIYEILYTYPRLAGNTSGDDNNVRALESLKETIVGLEEALNLGRGRDVREIGGDTRGVDDIEETQLD
jgi:hypothetical protein